MLTSSRVDFYPDLRFTVPLQIFRSRQGMLTFHDTWSHSFFIKEFVRFLPNLTQIDTTDFDIKNSTTGVARKKEERERLGCTYQLVYSGDLVSDYAILEYIN